MPIRLVLLLSLFVLGGVSSCSSGDSPSSSAWVPPRVVVEGRAGTRPDPGTRPTDPGPTDPGPTDPGVVPPGDPDGTEILVSNDRGTTLRGTQDFQSGQQSPVLMALLEEVEEADTEEEASMSRLESLFGFGSGVTEQQERTRSSFEYANQPSFDKVGAGFAYYDRTRTQPSSGGLSAFQDDGGLLYDRTGAGSSIRYLTDRRFGNFNGTTGRFTDTIGSHPELALSGGEALVRAWSDDITSRVAGALLFDPYVRREERKLLYTYNRLGTLQHHSSAAVRQPRALAIPFLNQGASTTPPADIVAVLFHPDPIPTPPRVNVHGADPSPLTVEDSRIITAFNRETLSSISAGIDDSAYVVARRSVLARIIDSGVPGFDFLVDDNGNPVLVDENGDVVPTDSSGDPLDSNIDINTLDFAYTEDVGYTYGDVFVQTVFAAYDLPWGATAGDFRSVGEEATAEDIGLLALIRGLVNPEDSINLAALRVSSHGIAPGAELGVLTTHGLREVGDCVSIARPTSSATAVGTCDSTGGSDYGEVKAVRGGVNLYDAILRAGAPRGVGRGNIILFDNRLQASGLSMVLATRDITQLPFADNNLWHIESQRAGGFSTDLGDYYTRVSDGTVALRPTLAADNGVKVYEQDGYKAKGTEVTTFDDTTLTPQQIVFAIIDGHYGANTILRSRNDLGADAQRALRLLLGMRHSLQRNDDSVVEDYDALIFAAQEQGGDIGLFAGLPLQVDLLVDARRAAAEADFALALRDGLSERDILQRAFAAGHRYDAGRQTLRTEITVDNVDGEPIAFHRRVFHRVPPALNDDLNNSQVSLTSFEFLEGSNQLRVVFSNGNSYTIERGLNEQGVANDFPEGQGHYYYAAAREVLFKVAGARTWVFHAVPQWLVDGLDSSASFEFVDNRNEVRVTLSDGRVHVLDVPTDLETPLPYYLAVVAAESGATPCGVVAQDFCLAAPGAYTYRDPGSDEAYDEDDTLETTTATARAAASLVAGGFALLQEVFDGQLNTAELVARIKQTASQNFDLDGDGNNDYTQMDGGAERYGHGLLDLECATRASLDRSRCRPATTETREFSPQACLLQGRGVNVAGDGCASASRSACRALALQGAVFDSANSRCVSETGCLGVQGRVIDFEVGECLTDARACPADRPNVADGRCSQRISAEICANSGRFLLEESSSGSAFLTEANRGFRCVDSCPAFQGVRDGNVCVGDTARCGPDGRGSRTVPGDDPGVSRCVSSLDDSFTEDTCSAAGRFVSSTGDACVARCAAGEFVGVAMGGTLPVTCMSTCPSRGVRDSTDNCISRSACVGSGVVSSDNRQCFTDGDDCPAGYGVYKNQCTSRVINDDSCSEASRFVGADRRTCVASCEGGQFVGAGSLGANTCYSVDLCQAAGGGREAINSGDCVTATALSCYNLGSVTYLYNGMRGAEAACVDTCASGEVRQMSGSANQCLSQLGCRELSLVVGQGAEQDLCVAASAIGCARDGGRGFENGACVAASASTCDTKGISFVDGECRSCLRSQGLVGSECRNIDTLPTTAEQITACAALDRLYDPASTARCVATASQCSDNRVQGVSGLTVNGVAADTQCVAVSECIMGGFGLGTNVCAPAAADTCYSADSARYFYDGSSRCVTDCGAGNARRTVGTSNDCPSEMMCRDTSSRAVNNGVCVVADSDTCRADGSRVFSTNKCVANARACINETGDLGYDSTTNSCVMATSPTECLAAGNAFFDGTDRCLAECAAGQGSDTNRECMAVTAANGNVVCGNASRRFDVMADACKSSNTCDVGEFLGDASFGANSCYTVEGCVMASGGRSVSTGVCVGAAADTCRAAGVSTYYFDSARGCVTACDMGGLTVRRALGSGNRCLTPAECRSLPHTGPDRGAVLAGDCVIATANTCAGDDNGGLGFRNGICIEASSTSCDTTMGIQFSNGRCMACNAGQGFVSGSGCTDITTLGTAAAQVDACAAAARLYDPASTVTCVATANDCTQNRIQGRSVVMVNNRPSNSQCISIAECGAGMSGVDTGRNRCVAGTAVTCKAVTSSTHYFDGDDGCVTSCSGVADMRTVTRAITGGNECVTADNCRGMAHTGSVRGAVQNSNNCVVANGNNCAFDDSRAFNGAMTGCVESCIVDDGGRGRSALGQCEAASPASCYRDFQSSADGFYDANASGGARCIEFPNQCANGAFGSSRSLMNECVADCPSSGQGVNSNNICSGVGGLNATERVTNCIRAERIVEGNACTETCSSGTPYYNGTDTCVDAAGCVAINRGVATNAASRFGRQIATAGSCATASAASCHTAGSSTYFFNSGARRCVSDCGAGNARRTVGTNNTCIAETACRNATNRGAVVGGMCVAASADTCFADGGMGFGSGRCVTASATTCNEDLNYVFDADDRACVLGSFVDVALPATITTRADALALFTGDPAEAAAADEVKNIRTEYQAQPSLAQVGAAQAYVSRVPNSGATINNLSQLTIGKGSQISVITNRRFDPSHPEFSSAVTGTDAVDYETLTRFYISVSGRLLNDDFSSATAGAHVFLNRYFSGDSGESPRTVFYTSGYSPFGNFEAYFSARIGQITNMNFDAISRTDTSFDGTTSNPVGVGLLGVFSPLLGGSAVDVTPSFDGFEITYDSSQRVIIVDTASDDDENFNHVGRIYAEGEGNLGSYQIVVTSDTVVRQDNNTYGSDVPDEADAEEMGLLVLINGMLDGAGGATNTHGIAPGATLNVFTSPRVGANRHNSVDLIYRARGIDIARDRDNNGNLIADPVRNIVLIQNTLAHSERNNAVTVANVNDVVGASGSNIADSYKEIYEALQLGVKAPVQGSVTADEKQQDIYVFAAADSRSAQNGVGLLAALPASTSGTSLMPYSVAVVAAEDAASAFCGVTANDFCLAAPGAYKYRDDGADNAYGGSDDTLETASATSNAAASLVAGGFAILEELFGDQLGSDQLVARMLATASQCFNINGGGAEAWNSATGRCENARNDYVGDRGTPTMDNLNPTRYGHGLMDLECATRASLTQERCRTASDAPSVCLANGFGHNGFICVTTGITTGDCGRAGGLLSGTSCIAASACTGGMVINVDNDECVSSCETTDVIGAGGRFATNRCYTVDTCIMAGGGLSAMSNGMCAAANARTCHNAGADTYFYDGSSRCVTDCGMNNVGRVNGTSNSCITQTMCRSNSIRGAVVGGVCEMASADNCFADGGLGFMTNECVTASEGTCSEEANYVYDGSSACVPGANINVRVSGIDTRVKALALFTGDKAEATASDAVKNIRTEYQAQPSLAHVHAAQAYVSQVAETGETVSNLSQLAIGKDSLINVITNRRFDPTHPEFSSSADGAEYETLTRFEIGTDDNEFTSDARDITEGSNKIISAIFNQDTGDNPRVISYENWFQAGRSFISVRVPQIDGRNFDEISRSGAGFTSTDTSNQVGLDLLAFFQTILGGDRVGSVTFDGDEILYNSNEAIDLVSNTDHGTARRFNHIGRVYARGNVGSYRVFATRVIDGVRQNNNNYASGIPNEANAAEMGLLVLINGLLDGQGGATNTHGIAPGATLNVFATPTFSSGNNVADWTLRARGIDLGRDRDGSGNLIADKTRHIVLIQNGVADSGTGNAVNRNSVNSAGRGSGAYRGLLPNLQLGVKAPGSATAEELRAQDIYVFAAADNRNTHKDVGILAAMPLATENSINISPYSVAVVAAENAANAHCGSVARSFCLAAPGSYAYRTKTGGSYGGGDDTIAVARATSNAAASLVAGGFAILEEIFGDQMGSHDLVQRMRLTASTCFNVQGAAGDPWNSDTNTCDNSKNDYVGDSASQRLGSVPGENRFGHGLMDLECATRTALERDGCRIASTDTAAGCLANNQGFNGVTCTATGITAAECVEAGGIREGTMNRCIARTACTSPRLFNLDNNTCVDMCDPGEGRASGRRCAAASDENCNNLSVRYDVGNDTCRGDQNCGNNEFRGDSNLGTNSCYTVASCGSNGGGRANAGSGLCVPATEATCYNLGATTRYLQNGDCVTSCTGGELTRSIAMMNVCVSDTNCRGSRQGAVSGTTCIAPSAMACNDDGMRAFNNAMDRCVVSCIANDSGRGRDSSHNCVGATGASCRLAGGNSNTMGFFDNSDSANPTCVATAGDCSGSQFGETDGSSNTCVTSCTNLTYGVDDDEICVMPSNQDQCGNANRFLQGGICVAACSGTTDIVGGALSGMDATCVAVTACIAGNLGVENGECATANAGTCHGAGENTYFYDGSSMCVSDCGNNNVGLIDRTAMQNTCVTETNCRDTRNDAIIDGVCVAASALTCFQDGGRGFDGTSSCVDAAADTCLSTSNLMFMNGSCVSSCTAGQGFRGGSCVALTGLTTGQQIEACSNIGRLYDPVDGTPTCVAAGANCSGDLVQGRREINVNGVVSNTQCITAMACGDATYGVASKVCVDAAADTCRAAGDSTYYFDTDGGCVTMCSTDDRLYTLNSATAGNSCATVAECRADTDTGTALRGACMTASVENCFIDGGRGFDSGECLTPTQASHCDSNANLVWNNADNCVSMERVNVAVSGITSRQLAEEMFTGDVDDTSADIVIRSIRQEYQNQPSLDIVGAAQAYVSKVAESNADIMNLSELSLGKDSEISVITNARFDPNHPEFASSRGSTFDTLTRVSGFRTSVGLQLSNIVNEFFGGDMTATGRRATAYTFSITGQRFYFTLPIGEIDSMPFENLARDDVTASGTARANQIRDILRLLTGNTEGEFSGDLSFSDTGFPTGTASRFIQISRMAADGVNHVGRIYQNSNIGSYQIVLGRQKVREADDKGECIGNNNCYSSSGGVPSAASDAQMGVLALINGLLDSRGGAENTHGIAPAATLHVFTAPKVGATGHSSADLIYRARSIDPARDLMDGTNTIIADDDRNIVLIQNTIAVTARTEAATVANVGDVVGLAGAPTTLDNDYKGIYDALLVGVDADSATQDAYVFAAADGARSDVGLLAALPIATNSKLAEYSIIVVAVEDGETTCGSVVAVQNICIAAPGAYNYRTRENDGTYTSTTLATATTANAAASLVAGGLALLESIFPTETTAKLVDRLLLTASQNYDLDNDLNIDWTAEKHGQGLLDLACAVRPALNSVSSRTRTGCTDRFGVSGAAACLANGQGWDGANCVTSSITAMQCVAAGGVLQGTMCIRRDACSTFFNTDDDECVTSCATGEGATSSRMCTATGSVGNCANASRLLDMGTTTCVTSTVCTSDRSRMNSFISSGSCVSMCAANQGVDSNFMCTSTSIDGDACGRAGRLLDFGTSNCISNTMCTDRSSGNQYVNAGAKTCSTGRDCAEGQGIINDACADVSTLSGNALTMACERAGRIVESGACAVGAVDENAIIEAFRGTGNTAVTSDLASTSGITDSSDTDAKRRLEYANQPSLDIVGAAFAYGKAGDGAAGIDAAIAKAGEGSNISVIMPRRFDTTHPEFSSSATGVTFETLTRFQIRELNDGSRIIPTLVSTIPTFFTGDSDEQVLVYNDGFAGNIRFLAEIQVPTLDVGGTPTVFESFSRNDIDGNSDARNALLTFFKTILGGTGVPDVDAVMLQERNNGKYRLVLALAQNGRPAYVISFTDDNNSQFNFNHVGRVYGSGSNIGSHRVVADALRSIRSDADKGECIDKACYGGAPVSANGAVMGVLALINGLIDPDKDGVAYNTHGIAPGATLNVFTSSDRVGGEGGLDNPVDLAYQARNIDVIRDRDSGGTLVADSQRDIVVLHNYLVDDTSSEATSTGFSSEFTGNVLSFRTALALGAGDSVMQDAFIFAARDSDGVSNEGGTQRQGDLGVGFEDDNGVVTDVGAFSALPVSDTATKTAIGEFSIIVVAVEDGQTPCGSNADVQAICIAAPGEFRYRNRMSDGNYATTLSTATSANAAASLVAGGLALLESIFPTETTARLIDRLLLTAAKVYDLDEDGVNDYGTDATKHGG
ncbi:MAG: hypothetical protein GDA50_05755 [Alphaproteobacteria bacterium GM202ARS2]|nr:hypothetical protein [Alphaproteobacteria bacterium GM202ARS2]